jgi:hypothetical protein
MKSFFSTYSSPYFSAKGNKGKPEDDGVAKSRKELSKVIAKMKGDVYNFFYESGIFQLENIRVIHTQSLTLSDIEAIRTSEMVIHLHPLCKVGDRASVLKKLQENIQTWSYYMGYFDHSVLSASFSIDENSLCTLDLVADLYRSYNFQLIMHKTSMGRTFFLMRKV